MTAISEQYSDLTISLTKNLTKNEKKEYGIFISPKVIIEKLVSSLLPYADKIERILEPSCGTCEVINYCDSVFNNVEIDGVEYNEKVFNSIKDLKFKNNVTLTKSNFMFYNNSEGYDLIIGNPPYFVCKKTDIPSAYHEFCSGRPNIFGLFIIHSLELIKKDGIVAFVLPRSFLNCNYYNNLRKFI